MFFFNKCKNEVLMLNILSEKLGCQLIPKQTPSSGENGKKIVLIIISLNISHNLYLLFVELL